jgi:uncharacterized protein YbjT (DUF2867 family)
MGIKIILTGATGMVGEGVLLECLEHPQVDQVLSVSRKPVGRTHPKLKEYLVKEFLDLQMDDGILSGYDACFFCAGVSSVGMKEDQYTRLTYDITLHFAKVILAQNPQSTFIYVSGRGTDSTESGGVMWARVKGRTENELQRLGFAQVHLFRPAFMKASAGQRNIPTIYNFIGFLYPVFKLFMPRGTSTLHQVGKAMINCVLHPVPQAVIEVPMIHVLADSKD